MPDYRIPARLRHTPKQPHAFTIRGVINNVAVLRCANRGCYIVWWANRFKPRSNCKGTQPDVNHKH